MIGNTNFHDMEAQRYWSFPKNYAKDSAAETKNMIFSGEYIGSKKVDGSFYRFIKNDDGTMELLGRNKSVVTNDYLNKIEWIPHLHDFFNELPNGTCLLGELYFPHRPGSRNVTTIMGCLLPKALDRQEKGDKLTYYVFDVLAYDGKDLHNKTIDQRVMQLAKIESEYGNRFDNLEFAQYHVGKSLWKCLQDTLAEGGEGVVITKRGTVYQPGKRPARQTLKIKKELQETIDCFFTGRATKPSRLYTGKEIESWQYWENLKTGEKKQGNYFKEYLKGEPIEPVTKGYFYGWAGSLEIGVLKDGKVKPIGFLSGLSEEIKGNVKKYQYKPLEITCMEIEYDDNNKFSGLRHARMLQFREDLTIEDCTWEKIFEK